MNLTPFYEKYGKAKVDEAVEILTYRHADKLPKEESNEYPTLYVFRHGQTTDNANFIFSGWRDSPITDEGKKQAEILAEKLKDKKIQMLVCSDQIRSIDTMKIAVSKNEYAKDLEIIKDSRIKEKSYGDIQGTSKIELFLTYPDLFHKYRRTYRETPPNGETIEDVVNRVKEFIDEIVSKMKENKINVAVSCHGNSIRGFRQVFENLTDEQTEKIETPLGQDYAAYVIK